MSDNRKVMLFGRKECEKSQEIAQHLKNKFDHVTPYFFKDRFDNFPAELIDWQGSYVFSFRCPVKIPEVVLKSVSVAAINFHPAPPNYRGSGSASLAIYEKAAHFGCTAHIMEKEIDTGQILECRRFEIAADETLPELWEKANEYTFRMALEFIAGVSAYGEEFILQKKKDFSSESWFGPLRTLKEIDALQLIDFGISEEEFHRIIRATAINSFRPYVNLYGHKFVYEK